MQTTEITLNLKDGGTQQVKCELNMNLKKIMFISRDFEEANDLITLVVSNNGVSLDMIRLFKIVYLSYRQANMNEYVSYDDFQEMYDFDMNEASQIYFSMFNKQYRKKYLEQINKNTPKVSSKA